MENKKQHDKPGLLNDIIKETGQLPFVPEQSVKAYKAQLYTLLEQVNDVMEAREDIKHLRGENARQLMLDNHKNHAIFMANVFRLNNFSLLESIVPWVYRSYHKRGFDFDYFPAHINAWKKAVSDIVDAENAAPILRIYDWMLSRHDDFITLSQNTAFISAQTSPRREKTCKRFLEALLEGDRQQSLKISMEHCSGADDIMDFYCDILRPAMYRIGELWENGELSVAEEHLATAIANCVIAMQYMQFNPPEHAERGAAIVASAHNEYHEMGARLVANALEMDGWDVKYLGANTPGEEILKMTDKIQPILLAVSVTMPFNLENVFELTDKVKKARSTRNTRVMLGGLAFNNSPELADSFASDGYAPNCRESVTLARRWWEQDEEHLKK